MTPWGRIVRGIAAFRDRRLHRLRRERAMELVRGRRIGRVLIMCHANVCRSPFAAATLQRELATRGRADVTVTSAGVTGVHRSSPATAVAVAADFGIDLSAHRATLITPGAVSSADLVVVMSTDQASDVGWRGAAGRVPVVLLGDFDEIGSAGRSIVDPWNLDTGVFTECYARIQRCTRDLAQAIAS